MCKMLSMQEVLSLTDVVYGYISEPEVEELLKADHIPEKYRHLIDRRTMLRYFELYSKVHGVNDYTEIIRNNGLGTKASRYNEQDILKCIKDPAIQAKIKNKLNVKTKPGPWGRIPSCIYHDYINMIIGDGGISEANLLATTGMTKHQLDLLSLLDDDLTTVKDELIDEINKYEDLLAELKAKYSDVIEEMHNRLTIKESQ